MEAPSSSFGLLDDYCSPLILSPSPIPWTRLHDKIFEHALVMVPENSPNRWIKIASLLPGKSAADVRDHYDALVFDVLEIDSGRVELPSYADDSVACSPERESSEPVSERKKGKPWTRKEHQLFILGLKKFGKGDWRSISRNVVITRTPTQVASHAQKYFLRHQSPNKDRKRSSIHDITAVESTLLTAAATIQTQRRSILSTAHPPPRQFAAPATYFHNHPRS